MNSGQESPIWFLPAIIHQNSIDMSCLGISMKALAAVRETLISSFYWREQRDETPLGLHHAFTGVWHGSEKLTEIQAEEFVEKAFIYNSIEYFKGEHARNNAEPIEWGDFIRCLRNCRPKRLPIIQLYKTLCMFDYNTEPKGWLEEPEYENWSRRIEFENFKDTLKKVKNYLAEFLVSRTETYKKAEWDY